MGIDRARRLGAIVVGRAGMDLYPTPDGTKIHEATSFASDVGGSAGNIAVALARFGVPTALLSRLSCDPVGRFVRTRLAQYGVDTAWCKDAPGEARTSLAFAETRIEDCDVVIYRNNAADWALCTDDVRAVPFAEASVLVVTGLALAVEPSRRATFEALQAARRAGTFSVLDVDYRAYGWGDETAASDVYRAACAQCDAVIGNDVEFDLIAESNESGLSAAERIVRPGGFCVHKEGSRGSRTFTSDASFDTPPFSVQARKPFGAGDAFMGGVVGGLLAGEPLCNAVTIGSAAAAIVVSRQGCASAMPTRSDVEQFIACRRPGE